MTLNLFTAIMLAGASLFLALRQILLSDKSGGFPCAPEAVRVAMFIGSAILLGLAVLFVRSGAHYAGEAAVPIAVLAGVFALYNLVMLVNIVRMRRPPEVWRRLDRVFAMASQPRAQRAPGTLLAFPGQHKRIRPL